MFIDYLFSTLMRGFIYYSSFMFLRDKISTNKNNVKNKNHAHSSVIHIIGTIKPTHLSKIFNFVKLCEISFFMTDPLIFYWYMKGYQKNSVQAKICIDLIIHHSHLRTYFFEVHRDLLCMEAHSIQFINSSKVGGHIL